MNDLPRIVVRIEENVLDKRWPYAVHPVSAHSLVLRTPEEIRGAEPRLLEIMKEYEAGRLTVYLETEEDTTHSVFAIGPLQGPETAVRKAADAIRRFAESFMTAGAPG